MPRRKKGQPPKYRLHKARNLAVVTIDGHNHYLGKYGSPESHEKYARLIAEWRQRQNKGLPPQQVTDSGRLIAELTLAYWEHCEDYYSTGRLPVIRQALRALNQCYANTPAADFGPTKLSAVRETLIEQGLSRTYINDQIDTVKRLFKWAVARELVSPVVYQGLQAIDGLRKGRSAARETEPINPVPEADVNATLPYLSPQVRDMVRLQLLSGCRPSEICILRPGDVDRTGDVWLYYPGSYKTQHTGRDRVIFFGPRAQEILLPWLEDRPEDAYCFSPAEAVAEQRSEKRKARKSKVQPSQRDRSKANPKRKPAERYNKDSYRKAIHRGCDKAGIPRWSPNQLRHSRATTVRRTYGLEAAQLIAGHANADVTQVYAERDLQRGKEIALEIG